MLATLRGNEIFQVLGTVGSTLLPSGQTETTTASAVATLAGGGGTIREINSGTSDTATTNDSVIAWNSSSASPKTENIPAGTFNGQSFTVVDEYGTAQLYNITINILGGATINGASSYVIAANNESVTMKWNGTSNYIII